jgi:hypothetical protein
MQLYQSFTNEEINLISQAWPALATQGRSYSHHPELRPALRVILVLLGVVLLELTALLLWQGTFQGACLPCPILGLLSLLLGVTRWPFDTAAITRHRIRRKLTKEPPHSVTVANGAITSARHSYPLTRFDQLVLCQDVAFCRMGRQVLLCKVPQDQQGEFLYLLGEANPRCLAFSKTPEELTGARPAFA